MDVLTLVLIIICIVAYCLRSKSDDGKTLPRKPGIPVVGHWLTDDSDNCQALVEDLKLGSVFTFDIGMTIFTRLNSYRAIKEIFAEKRDLLCELGLVEEAAERIGLFYSDGSVMEEHRQFLKQWRRESEMDRPISFNVVKEEVTVMIDSLALNQGAPVVSERVFRTMTKGVMARLVFGESNISDLKELSTFTNHVSNIPKITGFDNILTIFPWILQVPFLNTIFKQFSNISYHMEEANEFISRHLQCHAQKVKVKDSRCADSICEALLIGKELQQRGNHDYSCITDRAIKTTISELFVRGVDVTTNILTWATLLLALNPDVQERVHKEIQESVGAERFPKMEDQEELPFTRAVMDEVLRFASVLPLGFVHRTINDSKLLGFDLPLDSLVQCNVYGIHHDPSNWSRPRIFNPEHFLSEDGQYRPSAYLMPFSSLGRECVGESLIRMQSFLAIVALMQRFSVRLLPGRCKVNPLQGKMGTLREAGGHKIIFEKLFFDS